MKRQLMRFKSAFIRDGEMWCVPRTINTLFKANLTDWSVRSVYAFGQEEEFYIDYIFCHHDYVWCIAATGARVIGYHIPTGKAELFQMEINERRNVEVVLYNDTIFIIPEWLPNEIVRFSIKEKCFCIDNGWQKVCAREKLKGRIMPGCLEKNMISMAMWDTCKVLHFDLVRKTLKVTSLSEKGGLRRILQINHIFYAISNTEKKLFQWDEKTGKIKTIYCPYMKRGNYISACGTELLGGIFLTDGDTIDFFDIKEEAIYQCNSFPEGLEKDNREATLFFNGLQYEEKYFLVPLGANMLLEFNMESRQWKGHSLEIPDNIFLEDYIKNRLDKCLLIQEENCSLEEFVNCIRDIDDKKCTNNMRKNGYRIYEDIFKR